MPLPLHKRVYIIAYAIASALVVKVYKKLIIAYAIEKFKHYQN
jgi:hypothetical protein